MEDFISTLNHRVYTGRNAVNQHAGLSNLFSSEQAILSRLRAEITGKRLLDIGVGGGRTTPALLDMSSNYTAIDYSPEMVQATRRRFGLNSVWCCDARDMNRFTDSSFDFALFSFNSIDYIPYPQRWRIIGEVARVLSPAGIFMFSSHNRDLHDIGKLPWQRENLNWTPGFVKQCLKALLCLPRHARLRRHEVYEPDYAVVNDNAFSYSMLTCYVTISAQTHELLRAGFSDVRAHDMHGRVVTKDRSSRWIYYVARKSTIVPAKLGTEKVIAN